MFEEIGKTTMGAPFVYATISSPENLKSLEKYKKMNANLAGPARDPNRGHEFAGQTGDLAYQAKQDHRSHHLRYSLGRSRLDIIKHANRASARVEQ
jgi:hypothetical protein